MRSVAACFLIIRDGLMHWKRSKYFQIGAYLGFIILAACGGEIGETGPSCRFAISETFEQVCSGETCRCRLSVSIFNGGHLTVSGMLHYDAFNAEGSKVAYADFQVTDLTIGSSRSLQNDLLDFQTNKPLESCSNVSRVEETTVPSCP